MAKAFKIQLEPETRRNGELFAHLKRQGRGAGRHEDRRRKKSQEDHWKKEISWSNT